jgi:hypothetical protein
MFGQTAQSCGWFHAVFSRLSITLGTMGRKQKSGGFPERLVKRGLLSLAMAARMVHRRAYPQQYAIVERMLTELQLDALANVIASFAPVFTTNYRSAQFREITAKDRAGGTFHGGAREITFSDGRAPLQRLAVRVECIPMVAARLREMSARSAANSGQPEQSDSFQ